MRSAHRAAACFVDFDHTLFNTDEFFHVDLRDAFLRAGIDGPSWEESYARVWAAGYSPERHAAEIARQLGTRPPTDELRRLLLGSFSDLRGYLFPDVLAFLERGKEAGVAFYLLSFGDPQWQRYKVAAARVGEYFEDMFFTSTEGGKGALVFERARGFDRVVMVDNNPRELDSVRDVEPAVQTYWMNRVPDELLIPGDERSGLRFREARRYVGVSCRYRHIPCRTLDDVTWR